MDVFVSTVFWNKEKANGSFLNFLRIFRGKKNCVTQLFRGILNL
jgi:hypothetical protein